MSSEIYYRKAFVKISDDQFLPIIQSGSSNCFECSYTGRQLAEKNWYLANYPHKDKYIFTKKEINDIAKTLEKISVESGGGVKKTRNTPFAEGEFEKWFNAGIKTARTLEEYISYGNRLSVNDTTDYRQYKRFFVTTTQELLEMIKKMESDEAVKEINLSFGDNRNLYLPAKVKNTSELKNFFALVDKNDDNFYMEKKTSRKMIVCRGLKNARKFKTEKLAIDYLNRYPQLKIYLTTKQIINEEEQ